MNSERSAFSLLPIILLLMAYWFFGQLYEAVLLIPNWLWNAPLGVKRFYDFCQITSPRTYYEPLVYVGLLSLWWLWITNKDSVLKPLLRKAGFWSLLALVVNIFIIVTYGVKVFSVDYLNDPTYLTELCMKWSLLSIIRLVLIGITLRLTLTLYRENVLRQRK